jgi:hypothetical protein
MIHELLPWNTLTRFRTVPALKVARRPLVIGDVIVPVGETLDPELFPQAVRMQRLRQFYEMRLLELVDSPADSRQYYREQLARQQGLESAVPIEPVMPVASQIVADLPSVEVPKMPVFAPKKPYKGGK